MWIKNFNKKHNLKIETITHCIDEDSMMAIEKVINKIQLYIDGKNKVFINTTDGLSNVTTLISLRTLPMGVGLISYDRFDNEANVINEANQMQTYKIDQIIPIEDHFLLRNIVIENKADKKFVKKNKHHIISLFEKHKNEFKNFANYVQKENNPTLNNAKFKNINKIISILGIKNLKASQGLITGGLFEYYIFLKLDELDFDDIEIGVSVKKYINNRDFIPNEFDILFMKDNHLHMIECKFTKNVKEDQLVYKYMGLKSLLDDDGKICILTGHNEPLDIDNNPNPLIYLPYKRANANKILLMGNPLNDIDKFKSRVKDFFEI